MGVQQNDSLANGYMGPEAPDLRISGSTMPNHEESASPGL